jgi:hypothetical protein
MNPQITPLMPGCFTLAEHSCFPDYDVVCGLAFKMLNGVLALCLRRAGCDARTEQVEQLTI